MATRYGAFISYSRDADSRLAVALQSGVERFGRSWNRSRVVRVFRDDASLSANTGLWSSIEGALGDSGWFVLLASPEAAASKWVNREIEWWLAHNSADRILLVLTAGELVWREGDFDPTLATALPSALRGAFKEEPRYVDARWSRSQQLISDVNPQLREAVADVAATIRGIPKDELVGEAVRQQRRTRTIIRAVALGFAVLFAGVIVAAIVALRQRGEARDQARTSLSRQLAALADNSQSSDLATAELLAVQAYETEPNADTRGALIRADTASPALVRLVHLGGQVTAIASSPDGSFAAVGLAGGGVVRLDVRDPEAAAERVLSLDGDAVDVAVSSGGSAVAAADGRGAQLWRSNSGDTAELDVPAGQDASLVGLSPSGETAAAFAQVDEYQGASSLTIYGPDAAVEARHNMPRPSASVSSIQFPTERQIGIGQFGAWEERRVADWRVLWSRSVGFGAHEAAGTPSADGRWISATNGADTVPAFATDGSGDRDPPDRTAEAPLSGLPNALAVGPTGKQMAIADGGAIYVAPLAPPGRRRSAAVALRGAGATGTNLVRFLGDGDNLISAAGTAVAIWDLRQLDRLASVARIPLGYACEGCVGPRLAVSPAGDQVAVDLLNDTGGRDSGLIAAVGGGAGVESLPLGTYAPPSWLADDEVVFPLIAARIYSNDPVPDIVRIWATGHPNRTIEVTAPAAEQGELVTVDERGHAEVRDGETGAVVRQVPDAPAGHGAMVGAAVDDSGRLIARLFERRLEISDLATGAVLSTPPVADVSQIAYAGERLLIQRTDGALEVWDARATSHERTLPGDATYLEAPVGSPDGSLVAREHNTGEITIADLGGASTLATLRIPPEAATIKTAVGFGPGGMSLDTATQSYPYGILVHRDLSPDHLTEVACRTAGRALTVDEWDRLVGGERPNTLACSDAS